MALAWAVLAFSSLLLVAQYAFFFRSPSSVVSFLPQGAGPSGAGKAVTLWAKAPEGIYVGFERCSGNLSSGSFSTLATVVVGTSVPPGSYLVNVSAVSGGLTRSSTLLLQVVPFKVPPVTYNVTISEVGLPSGTSWSATLNGITKSTSSSSVTFTGLGPGQYAWNVTGVVQETGVRYVASSPSGTLSVPSSSGAAVYYGTQYEVTVTAGPDGSVSPSGSGWYAAGTGFVVKATPSSGYEFSGWTVSGG